MGKWRYGVVLDAGSSGTRLHVYRWLENAITRKQADAKELKSLPDIKTEEEWTKKIHPGVSSFADNPEQVGPDHLATLLKHARSIVPDDAVRDTPIFLLATAGMRLLDTPKQRLLLNQICSYVRTNSDFLLPNCDAHIQVISGVTEGLYGWIATNYLLDSFDSPETHDHGQGHHTYGFLDMGGASTQIAFEPNATEALKHADDLKLLRLRNIDGSSQEHKVFVTSWLEFGVHEARRRFVTALKDATGPEHVHELPDPCLPAGLQTTLDGKALSPTEPEPGTYLLGTGKFDECLRQTYTLLDKDAPCPNPPCLLHGVHVPAIDFDVNHFIGISEFWHTTHEIFDVGHKDKAYDFHTYQHRVEAFCSQDWQAIEDGVLHDKWGKKISREAAYEVCFKASWIINMLHNGIGVPRVGLEEASNAHNGTKESVPHGANKGYLDAFQAVNKIHSTEVSWTLGKMILYASSQIPPADEDTLPVGFGSNVPGIPADFQYPSVELVLDTSAGDVQSEHWHDALFHGHSSRRIPGFVLFLFIIILAAFFLCGRSRRLRVYHKLGNLFRRVRPSHPNYPKRRRLFSGKLSFLNSDRPSYERVLEDGNRDFELTASESDGSDMDGGRPSDADSSLRQPRRASTWGSSTPTLKFDLDNTSTTSIGLGISLGSAMDREGLVVRTESRDHLVPVALGPMPNGRRSRTGSPARPHQYKSPITTPSADD